MYKLHPTNLHTT